MNKLSATIIAATAAATMAAIPTAARTVPVVSIGETTAQIAFGDADGKAYKLAVCYGDEDGGATTNTWDSFEILGTVAAADTSRTVALPAGWGSTVTHLRYFLLGRPYAADLEFIGTGNKNTPAGVYFDSGVKAKDGTKMVAELMVYSDSGNKEFCGAQNGSDVFRLYGVSGNTQRLGYCGSGATINGSSYPIDKKSLFRITTTLDAGSQSISSQKSTNGGSSWSNHGSRTDTQAGPVDWDLDLYILAANSNGTAVAEAAMKLYSLTLYSSGDYTTPVRDFVPVLDENGVACLYDKASGGLFYNQGANDPTQGTATPKAYGVASSSETVVAPLPPTVRYAYIQADGTDDYIDLGIVAKDGTKMFAEMEWVSILPDRVFCGARKDSGHTRFFLYSSLEGVQRYGYATGNPTVKKNGSSVRQSTGVRYRVTSQFEAGAQTISIQRQDNGAWVDDAANADTAAGPVDTGLPLYLFARNKYGETADCFCAARVYSLKLWQKDGNGDYQLVRDFVPAKTIYDEVALWDRVSETWFRNCGTGALSHGAERPWEDGVVIRFW